MVKEIFYEWKVLRSIDLFVNFYTFFLTNEKGKFSKKKKVKKGATID